MTGVIQDFRYSVRQMRRDPGFTAVAVLTLTLGIGANTGIFTLVNAVLLKSLPVPSPEQLFLVQHRGRFAEQTRVSYPLYDRMLKAMPTSVSLAAMTRVGDFYVGNTNSQPEMTKGQLVSGNYFRTFRTYPMLGRLLTPADNLIIDGHPVAVISYGCWKRRFAGAPDVVGRELMVNGIRFTVVGVTAPDFFGVEPGKSPDVWLPLMMQSSLHYSQHYSKSYSADGNKPWVSQADITWLNLIVRAPDRGHLGRISGVLNQLFFRDPWEERVQGNAQNRQVGSDNQLELEPGGRGIKVLEREFSQPLLVLTGMVALVLLIACANLASLMLARATARTREIAVRLSIGATRTRLVRQLLTECLVLSILGGLLGVSVAYWCDLVLPKWASSGSLPIPLNLSPDVRVLLFTVVATLVTGVLFGLVPAYRTVTIEPAQAVKTNRSGSNQTRGKQWSLRQGLVALQIALSLVLLFGAGLFIRTLRNFERLNPGFDRDRILTVWLDTSIRHYSQDELRAFYERVIDRIEALPGVESASLATCGIASDCHSSSDIWLPGHSQVRATPQTNIVSLRYFQNVGIPFLRGRDFTAADDGKAPHVAIINQTLARKVFPDVDPIGQHFGFDPSSSSEFQIIGIIQDAQVNNVRTSAPPMIYFPLLEAATNVESLDVRAVAESASLADQVRQVLKSVDPELPIGKITTLAEQVNSDLVKQRLIARLTSIFGTLALGFACLGLYGVMSYSAVRRTAELGIRLALGASRRAVLWLMLHDALVVIGAGIFPGLLLSVLAGQTVRSFLFGLSAYDPETILAAALLLAVVAVAAGLKPAWRAAQLDPIETLRGE